MDFTPEQQQPSFATRFRLRTRVFGTLLLALLAAGAQLAHAASGGDMLPLFILMALLCNAASYEAWRVRGGEHRTEFAAALLFPWVMMLALTFAEDAPAEPEPAEQAHELSRPYGASFACWAVVALAVLLRDGIRLRGLGMPLIQQSVAKGVLCFLYPVGFLGIAMGSSFAAACAFIGCYLFYRAYKALTGNGGAALVPTAATAFGLSYLCTLLGGEGYGQPAPLGGAQASYYGGLGIIAAALLLPAVKTVKFFRTRLGGDASPLPVLGFLGDILALPALPCALAALLILGSRMLLGAGAALNF